MTERDLILLTGATGYVGGRLLRALESSDRRIRCLARRPQSLEGRVGPKTEVAAGDLSQEEKLCSLFEGVQIAYYMVHSMGARGDFEEGDRRAAGNFARCAAQAGVKRIIYLGGLGSSSMELSPHLKSRHEVGDILRDSGVQTVEFRASIILGSGSLSFEMVRALVERLPIMVTPRWVDVPAQPIGISDMVSYLTAALDLPLEGNHVFEVGGADRVTYGDIMREYARQRGLKRTMIPVPFLTPKLSSLWLGLVTPLYSRVGRKLIDSIRHPTVVLDDAASRIFPRKPLGFREAIALAIRNEDKEMAETRWCDALSSSAAAPSWVGTRFGNRIIDSRSRWLSVTPEKVFEPIERIGGETGWYYANWLWRLRGSLDLVIGGAGMRRGRLHPERLRPGDTVDFWRVEACEPPRRLRLSAELRLPGRAWLEFEVEPAGEGSMIRQTAIFDPVGLSGFLYWYLLYPTHRAIFSGMLREIARAAARGHGQLA